MTFTGSMPELKTYTWDGTVSPTLGVPKSRADGISCRVAPASPTKTLKVVRSVLPSSSVTSRATVKVPGNGYEVVAWSGVEDRKSEVSVRPS